MVPFIQYVTYGFLLVNYSNLVHNECRFWDIWPRKLLWPWNPGQWSLKVIGTETHRSAVCDLLLTLHSNHGPISHRFRYRQRFQSKITNITHPVYITPQMKDSPFEFGIGANGQKIRLMGIPDSQKSFRIGLAVLTIPACDRQTDRQSFFNSNDRAYAQRRGGKNFKVLPWDGESSW